MTFLFPALLIVIVIACVGFLYPEGMWSNAVRLVNVIFAALIAVTYYEPLAKWAEGQAASFTFFWDYLSLWGIFCLSMIIFHVATRQISQVKVRFLKLADSIGSGVFAALIGYVLVCFTTMSMHTAPLGRTFFRDSFDPMQAMFVGMHPDQQWLGFTQWLSKGAYATNPENVFDPGGQFINTYALRRDKVEKYRVEKQAFRVADGDVESVRPDR